MTNNRQKLILASRSPRRKQLLAEAGYVFDVIYPSDSAESEECGDLPPRRLVESLAHGKAADVACRIGQGLVIGCDTVAECEGRILGKPRDLDHAREMLALLSGRRHRVLSGLCLWPVTEGNAVTRVDETVLMMDSLSREQLESYLAGRQWEGKAGAFGYQDGLDWVHVVEGSESNVVGLPMELLAEMLGQFQ